jgi:7-cyano-7-deazaguanine reductase
MNTESPLGRPTSYLRQYAPEVLHAIARADSRTVLGLGEELPFRGVDIWNAWELTWLDSDGKPAVAAVEMRIPADSINIVESKSLKLYLDSFAMTRFVAGSDVAETIAQDLSSCAGADVSVRLHRASQARGIAHLPGDCLDEAQVVCDAYEIDSTLLEVDPDNIVREDLHSHLLRSLCPVTNQPDSGSLLVAYRGPRIERRSLLRYIVSYREHHDFHEACVERMFIDILERCSPEQLTVYARYQRRGGIDINPFRSNFEKISPNLRLWRQ